MNGTPTLHMAGRLYRGLARILLPVILCLAFSAEAHVGVHEEIERLSSLIQQGPANPQLYVSRGEAYRVHGDRDRAIADFRSALAIDPDNVAAMTALGRTHLETGNTTRAIADLSKAIARDPGNVRALILRAQAYTESGKPLVSVADYSRAIAQFNKPAKPLPGYYLERARAYAAAGDAYIGEALLGLDEGIDVLGNIRILELYAVDLETRRGHFDNAIERLDNILARTVRKESMLLQRGDILMIAGNTTGATQDYLAALAAIDALPPQRRHTRAVRKLQADLNTRLTVYGNASDMY